MIFDTHTHIYLEEFGTDCHDVVQRAIEAGVEKMMLPNVDLDTLAPLKGVWQQYPQICIAAMGLHPTSVTKEYATQLKQIYDELKRGDYHAVGEVGIDLYWDKTYRTQQIEAFAEQLRWANEMSLPVIIHNREALADTIATLKQQPVERFVMHSFGGTPDDVKRVRGEAGDAYFGINGVVTFKNAHLEATICEIGIDRLVVETDAPYLSPVPYRGKRNEPSYIVNTVKRVAEILAVSQEEVELKTYDNACKLFAV